jgi:hypothetical protein
MFVHAVRFVSAWRHLRCLWIHRQRRWRPLRHKPRDALQRHRRARLTGLPISRVHRRRSEAPCPRLHTLRFVTSEGQRKFTKTRSERGLPSDQGGNETANPAAWQGFGFDHRRRKQKQISGEQERVCARCDTAGAVRVDFQALSRRLTCKPDTAIANPGPACSCTGMIQET